jgi:hypothetical protein
LPLRSLISISLMRWSVRMARTSSSWERTKC